ncbi:antibiotic biosynthesis monooxygenase family protein [Hyphomicrobium sp.]|uniref:putative quinol monooxygenase n=1 Tax=Hyphomicrobium sp. TaxID=82 RepID=UPI002E378573|nr:antibiotic biosynthesis monooxygenase family protein [Hyphomicrobium sp.]HEX2840802.1 antibiotic biosynthesis monooxygenase family protein [Hyphomicrobium sp.]
MSNAIVVTMRLTPSDPNAFQTFLTDILPDTRKARGCRSCTTHTEKDNAGNFLLLQEWDSIEDQQAYMAWRDSTGVLKTFLGHLAKPAEVNIWQLNKA